MADVFTGWHLNQARHFFCLKTMRTSRFSTNSTDSTLTEYLLGQESPISLLLITPYYQQEVARVQK